MKQLYDIIIVGAGPAGLAAAHAAAPSGASICIIDDNPLAGGQIWRGGAAEQRDGRAREMWQAIAAARNVRIMPSARVLYAPAPGELLVQDDETAHVLRYQHLILATGARELLLPFPGWTLPGVTGAGGLQALAKGGYPVEGKRVVVAGSGPLLLAVADTLIARGAEVVAIIEQAPLSSLARFALGLGATPSKLAQALQLAWRLRAVSYRHGAFVRAAYGDGRLQRIELHDGEQIECDFLACGYGLLPNTELARALGCTTTTWRTPAVQVDEWQRTSVPSIYCAGEGTGIGGVDLALAEGRIAGLHASGQAPASAARGPSAISTPSAPSHAAPAAYAASAGGTTPAAHAASAGGTAPAVHAASAGGTAPAVHAASAGGTALAAQAASADGTVTTAYAASAGGTARAAQGASAGGTAVGVHAASAGRKTAVAVGGWRAPGGSSVEVRKAFAERTRWTRFAARLAKAFELRQDLKQLCERDTIVCRCEDVTHGELQEHTSWRAAKLYTRCGMGPCQGRICGAATAQLYGWQPDTVRTPISPARAGSIIATEEETET
jgi:NADPH-dependent 2,4-dienoyl-CoA reductase/sulfur reductase-like enzyme